MAKFDQSLSGWFSVAAKQFSHQPALITTNESWDFSSLTMQAGKLLTRYTTAGLCCDQPIAILTRQPSRLAWLAYLCLYSGCTFLPLDARRRSHRTLLEECAIRQVIADSECVAQLPSSPHNWPSEWVDEFLDIPWAPPNIRLSSKIQVIISTSGTSGAPRGAMLTVRNVHAAVIAARKRQELTVGDVWLNCLPLFHIGGLSILLRCSQAGACMVLHERFEPARVWEDLRKWRVTHLSLVPTMLALLLDFSKESAPPKALRTVLVGGSALSAKLAQRAYHAGWSICPTYGLSEAASQVATGSPINAHWCSGDVGFPLDGVRVDIVDDYGRATQSEGRIRIAGATLMAGYANPEVTLGCGLVDHAYISNDIGYIDKIGHLHVSGRADDRLISGGATIHPKEIEDQILNCPGVEDVAISARPDETWGQYLIAVVTGPVEVANLRAWCELHLPSFQRPREFLKLDEIPRTSLGKLQRRKLMDWIAQL